MAIRHHITLSYIRPAIRGDPRAFGRPKFTAKSGVQLLGEGARVVCGYRLEGREVSTDFGYVLGNNKWARTGYLFEGHHAKRFQAA
ncbi:MAG TPA: hypothetical protein VGZ00_08100 [Candidatus Baltobacteraceae bacterium]|jgi:hypothetical protein|nr:hypothetical protein [Candidatus Baltobacteraceae bacterium]